MKEEVKSPVCEERSECYFPEYAPIDSNIMSHTCDANNLSRIDSGMIFG
jgi:hypothetical protein